MTNQATLPATLYLLAFDVDKQRLPERQKMGYLTRAAALVDLTLRERLDEKDGKAVVSSSQPTGDVVLDRVMEEIGTDKPRKWKAWVQRRPNPTLKLLEETLEADGVFTVERTTVLGFVPRRKTWVKDPGEPQRLRAMVDDVLRGARPVQKVDPFEAAVTSLAAASQLRGVVSAKDKRRYKERIDALTERTGAAVPALGKVLQEIQAAAVAAAVSVAATAGSGN